MESWLPEKTCNIGKALVSLIKKREEDNVKGDATSSEKIGKDRRGSSV